MPLQFAVAIPVDRLVARGETPRRRRTARERRHLRKLPRRHPGPDDVPARVIRKLPGGRGRGHGRIGLRHANELIGGVVEPPDRVRDGRGDRRLPAFLHEPVRRVIDERRDTAEPVGLTDPVADEVVGKRRGLAARIGLRDEPVPAVIGVAGDVARGVGHARGVADRVVGGPRRTSAGVRHRRATIELVVAIGRHEPERVGDPGEVTDRIVAEAGDGPL